MNNGYTHYTELVRVPGDIMSRWETSRIEPGQEYPMGHNLERAGVIKDDPEAPVWVELEHACGSDYSGSTLERANYLTIREQFADSPDVAFLYGGYGSFGVLVREDPTTDEVRDLVAGLADYPCVDEEALSEHESELSDEGWDSWARADFLKALLLHLAGHLEYDAVEAAIEQLDERDKPDQFAEHGLSELFRAAMKASNTYWEADGTGMWVDVPRVTKVVTPEMLAAFIDETYTR